MRVAMAELRPVQDQRAAVAALRNARTSGGGVVLFGPTGTGKSRLLQRYVGTLAIDGVRVWYVTEPMLIEAWRESFNDRDETAKRWGEIVWRQADSVDVLVLDELGSVPTVTEPYLGRLQRLLDLRESVTTCIGSNVYLDDPPKGSTAGTVRKLRGERISSRIWGCAHGDRSRVVAVDGNDLRKGVP